MFGQQFRIYREHYGLSQSKMVEMMRKQGGRATLMRYRYIEGDRAEPSLRDAAAFCRALSIDLQRFVDGVTPPATQS